MTNKWTNLGDVNHRLYGGIFVQVDTENENVEVVIVDNMEDTCGMERFTRNKLGQIFHNNIYHLQEAEYTFDELKEALNNKKAVFDYGNWDLFTDKPFEEVAGYLAADMIRYFGGSNEGENSSNYWYLLNSRGITKHNIN
tara:strand:+ start:37832 stop:38251 length:420 start_codon:yes stop_codon:yes gene_type:complete